MAHLIELGSGTANQRTIHFRLFTSNGTAPDTGASNDSVIVARGSATTFTPNVLVTAVNSAQGMYSIQLTSSDVSNLGQHAVYYAQGDFPQHVANFDVVNFNPYSSQSNIPLVTNVTNVSNATVAADSNVTVGVIVANAITNAAFAADSISSDKIADNALGTEHFADNALSSHSVGLVAATHPGVTIPTVTNVTNVSNATVAANSNVTVGVIVANAVSASAIAANALTSAKLDVSAYTEIAKSVLTASLVGSGVPHATRNVASALRPLRNFVDASTSVLTVYAEDDSTSAWTASLTTGTSPIVSMNPQ